MKNRIKPRDYELISAYLDNQLSSKERVYLEARLKAIPELQKEMDELSKARAMLRGMPRMRAPRNYFVTAKMVSAPVKSRPSSRYAPVMGIVSAVTTIMLVMVIFGQNLLEPAQPMAMAPAVAPVQTEALLTAPQAQSSAAESNLSPTEAAPVMMSKAPPLPTEEPFTSTPTEEIGGPTPTTIYLFAYLPTETPEGQFSIMGEQGIENQFLCDQYQNNPTYPLPPAAYNCPTQTPTTFGRNQGLFAGPNAVTETPTPTQTATTTATPTDTPTPTLTPSPTPTETPTPTPTVTPYPTETALSMVAEAPATSPEAPVLSAPATGANDAEAAERSGLNPNEDSSAQQENNFTDYLFLAIKVGLASIAVLSGLAAVFLRLRPGP